MASKYGFMVILLVLGTTSASNLLSTCEHHYNLTIGEVYHIESENYPGETNCKWIIYSKPSTRIALSCRALNLKSSENCTSDALAVSINGDATLSDATHYCGNETIDVSSESNTIAVGYSSILGAHNGQFACTLQVVDKQKRILAAANCDCGWRLANGYNSLVQNRNLQAKNKTNKHKLGIVGGFETVPHEFPSMAGILDVIEKQLYCGGAIISTRYVLTAGHCVYQKDANSIAVLAGAHDINNADSYAKAYIVSAYEINPGFNYQTQINDIAILQTAETMVFSLYVGPACLPFRYVNQGFYGQPVIAVGWGALTFFGTLSTVLREVTLPVISRNECMQRGNPELSATQMCTYLQGKDTCQGDSGGPLFWRDPNTNRLILVGIVSTGYGCASTRPGISTLVSPYNSWIVARTSDANYCVM